MKKYIPLFLAFIGGAILFFPVFIILFLLSWWNVKNGKESQILNDTLTSECFWALPGCMVWLVWMVALVNGGI